MNTPGEELELVERWRQGDRSAGELLLRPYSQPLLLFFRNKAGDAAFDLVQRTLLECVQSVRNYRGEGSFRSFLFAIAYRTLCKHYSSKVRDGANINFSTASVYDLAASPSEIIAEREEQRLLLEALRRLPLDAQVTLELYYWESMTADEIARVLAIPVGTAKSRLRRARDLLRTELKSLAQSVEVLTSTLANLDGWAKALHERLMRPA